MIKKSSERKQITLNKKSLKIIKEIKRDLQGGTNSEIINAIISEFSDHHLSVGYSQLWETHND